jgi:hypothetical protein
MIVLFNENVLLLSTYKFIVIPIKYHNFGAFAYDSPEKQMLSAISLVIEQRKNEFDRISKVRFSQSIVLPCEGDIIYNYIPDTCQDLILVVRVTSQVLKTS